MRRAGTKSHKRNIEKKDGVVDGNRVYIALVATTLRILAKHFGYNVMQCNLFMEYLSKEYNENNSDILKALHDVEKYSGWIIDPEWEEIDWR